MTSDLKQMSLGQLIRLTREANGLTLRALETQCGLSNALISQIETGWIDDISLRNAAKLADALGITLKQMAATRAIKKTRSAKMRALR